MLSNDLSSAKLHEIVVIDNFLPCDKTGNKELAMTNRLQTFAITFGVNVELYHHMNDMMAEVFKEIAIISFEVFGEYTDVLLANIHLSFNSNEFAFSLSRLFTLNSKIVYI